MIIYDTYRPHVGTLSYRPRPNSSLPHGPTEPYGLPYAPVSTTRDECEAIVCSKMSYIYGIPYTSHESVSVLTEGLRIQNNITNYMPQLTRALETTSTGL